MHILLHLKMTDVIPCTTLHELASKTFSRTPNGVIFTDDIKMIYSTFLICLNLREESPELKRWYSPFGKSHHAFSFSMEEGVERMGNLKISVDMTTTSIEICYNIQPELAYHLIKTFMEAKLLHTPADRTRSMPKNKSILQPTPKGVGILQKYVRRIGLKSSPPILLSDFNSMEIFTFERSPVTDSIIYSNRLICILLNKMMGSGPNVWSPEKVQIKSLHSPSFWNIIVIFSVLKPSITKHLAGLRGNRKAINILHGSTSFPRRDCMMRIELRRWLIGFSPILTQTLMYNTILLIAD